MTDQERDALLLGMRADVRRLDKRTERTERKVDVLATTVDAMSDQLQDVARTVRELAGDVADDPPHEATG